MSGKNICIIGAGIGGLTAGALLTKKGYNVKIFERELLIGGRALSFNMSDLTLEEYKNILTRFNMNIPFSVPDLDIIFNNKMFDGYKLDLGYHTIGGGSTSEISEVLSVLGKNVDFFNSHIGFIDGNRVSTRFLSWFDRVMILPKILRLLFASERIMTQLDTVSMTETIKKYGHGKMKLILEIFSRSITTVNNLDRISTGEMFRAQKNLYKGSRPVGYPRGGLRNITQQLAEYILENGGEIHLGKPINKIIIKNNKATGIFIDDEEHNFDVIISDILVQDFFNLTNESDFPEEYVKNLKSLTGTSSLCAFYSLKKVNSLFIGKTFHFIERNIGIDGNDAVGMIDMMTAMKDSGLTSNSNHIIQSYIICTPDETKNKETLEKLKKLLDKNLETLIPDFREQLNWAIYPLVWHLDGVAKTIDNLKPDIKTPIQNLYLVGDCVKAPGIGITCAVTSAVQLVSIM